MERIKLGNSTRHIWHVPCTCQHITSWSLFSTECSSRRSWPFSYKILSSAILRLTASINWIIVFLWQLHHHHRIFYSSFTSCSSSNAYNASKIHLEMVVVFRRCLRTGSMPQELCLLYISTVDSGQQWIFWRGLEQFSILYIRTIFYDINDCVFDLLKKKSDLLSPSIIKRG